ncbi:glycosyltransferase family 4 protein [Chenggangzhangella methanolivorans]|uniref:Glycosyltransferase family 4 protein n=1 Tax=Chenggangzhangella methanolivorans TaxID=1437009 RepID=A0A9E6RGI8_9HYPH|nr:glycosyltransferase family 4 protein [Chenggangzhangella methanolivorans]QZO01026.1 glycosyltransferase family 4 protein [Chenggangzhangella methanolivorans]
MSAPRLLAINNYFYRRGGAEAVFLDQMRMFSEIGWDVVPFAMQHPENDNSAYARYFVSEIEYGRESGPLTKAAQAAKIIYSFEARRKLKALIESAPPALAHAHNVYHHISPSIFDTLKRAGVPTVMTAHDLKLACPAYKMLSHDGVCERCKGGRVHNVLVNRCIKGSVALSGLVMVETMTHRALGLYRDKVDRVVAPSRFYREKLAEWGWDPARIAYVPNFVDAAAMRSDWDEGDHFVFAGRLGHEKGLSTLVRAAAMSGERVMIAGTGPEEAALKRLAAELDAPVTFLGYVSGQPLLQLIGESRALVLPSEWYENAPMSVLEAYGLGTPILGARIGGIPELVREGETGLLARSGDVEDLAGAMSRMAALRSGERRRMGAAGREWVLADFSQNAHRDRLLALYRDLGVAA